MKKVIIVGTNHAGTVAARTLKQLNPDLEVVVYDRNDNISFLGCGIALWVKGEFDDPDGLFYATPELLQKEGIKVHMLHDCTSVDPDKKEITLHNLQTGKEVKDHYDKIIFAVGSWPIVPPIPGIKLDNIKIVKLFKHGKAIKEANQDPAVKKVVVCGAGYIGVELVDAFHAAGKEVTLIDICERIMPNYYDVEFTDKVTKAMKDAGVRVATGETVKEFRGTNNQVTHVITDKNEYEADLVIWCVGFRPNTALLKDKIALTKTGNVVVNAEMQTSHPDVYAIGDCVEVYNNARECTACIALATTAIRTGILAAMNIALDKKIESPGFQGSNAISVFDWNLSSTGMSELACQNADIPYKTVYLEDWDRPTFMQEKYRVQFKLLWRTDTKEIIGAAVGSKTANHTEIIHMLSLAIKQKIKIDDLALVDMFFLPHFNQPFNYVTKAALKAISLSYNER